ncbi:SanA/YdcF family protein [Microscilla marina]|nr:ElyC/SanA/YdcF family protein [Microscilla marina]
MKKKLKKLGLIFLGIIVINIILIVFCNWRIEQKSSPDLFSKVGQIPANKVGLVLGTSKWLSDGRVNLYFKYRIEAAVALYKAKKIKYILVSGDNRFDYYNEPREMHNALVASGVPSEVIVLDYAGFRTLDSVVRSKKVFGQQAITIISQPFHNKRALFIASNYGMKAVAFNAKDVNLYMGFKTQLREKLARVKVFLDLYVTNKQPRFLGEKIEIGA